MRIAFDSALKWVDLLPWLGGDMRADSRDGQGSFTSFMTYIVKITFFQHSSTTWVVTHRGFMDLRALDWYISNWSEQIVHKRLKQDLKVFQLKAVFHPFSKPLVLNRVKDAGAYPSILGHRQGISLYASNSQLFMSFDHGENQNTQRKPIPTQGEHAKSTENSLLAQLPWCPTNWLNKENLIRAVTISDCFCLNLNLFCQRNGTPIDEEWNRDTKLNNFLWHLSSQNGLKNVSGTASFVGLETIFVSNKYIPYIYQTPIQTIKKTKQNKKTKSYTF